LGLLSKGQKTIQGWGDRGGAGDRRFRTKDVPSYGGATFHSKITEIYFRFPNLMHYDSYLGKEGLPFIETDFKRQSSSSKGKHERHGDPNLNKLKKVEDFLESRERSWGVGVHAPGSNGKRWAKEKKIKKYFKNFLYHANNAVPGQGRERVKTGKDAHGGGSKALH